MANIDVSILGPDARPEQFESLANTFDNRFFAGKDGVQAILATTDGKIEFVFFGGHVMAHVKSAMGYPAYYPMVDVKMESPVKAVLMDLDGTSVRSEHFWIWIIQMTTASLLENPKFELEDADLPYVSGHSVSEHLEYCVKKYCPHKTVEQARDFYFEHTHHQMAEIMAGRGRKDAFTPTPGLKDFLYALKDRDIKIGLVTSGLYEKAWPEILSAFNTLDMGDPAEFYDSIITAGYPIRKGFSGTLGELSPKPHPWLYAEVCRVGLGIAYEDRNHVLGIEDSAAGVCSVKLAGYPTIGFDGGNIDQSGTRGLCDYFCDDFEQVLKIIG